MAEPKLDLSKYNRPVNCDKCGAGLVYGGLGAYQCERCKNEMYDDYGKVRNYVEMHPGANVALISFETGVTQDNINAMLREERFEISHNSKISLKCKACGKDIRSGVYCPVCAKLAEAAAKRKARESAVEEHQKGMSVVGMNTGTTESGAMRFTRDRNKRF